MNDNNANRSIILGPGNTLNHDKGLSIHSLRVLEAWLSMMTGGKIELLDIQLFQGG
jgi:hypothetical protein